MNDNRKNEFNESGFRPEIIPAQDEGKALEARSRQEFPDTDAAKMAFLEARENLLDVNRWAESSGGVSATFQLVNPDGYLVDGAAEKGQIIRIDIPGPGTEAGGGYDWAVIDEMEEGSTDELDYLAFRVRPTKNPAKNDGEEVDHFFSETSTGTFVLYRRMNEVICTVYDRNLKANTETEGSFIDKIRNSFVGNTAASGMSGVQWQKLTDSLLSGL